jgi:predicted ATPase
MIYTQSDHIINLYSKFYAKNRTNYKTNFIYNKQNIKLDKCGHFINDFPEGFFDAILEDIYSLTDNCL